MSISKADSLGDRLKKYESREETNLLDMCPVICRLDGKSFHSFTKGLNRPYDERMSAMMTETAKFLAEETNACMAYTQSDEITLTWFSEDTKSQIWFNGRHSKMVSVLAAMATLKFYQLCLEKLPDYAKKNPLFDARVFTVPNTTEGANVFLWREWDATKNSITMAARSVFSDKAIFGKNGSEKQEMLFSKGITWNNYPAFFKRGTYIQKRTVSKPFTAAEINKLPPKHAARTNPALVIERSAFQVLDMPPFGSLSNREAVIYEGAKPVIKTVQKT